jgi:hypothetical protein
LDTNNILRPAINFGNDILFSGQITSSNRLIIRRGKSYKVSIEMRTVEDEAYNYIKELVKINNIFLIQLASRVIGRGIIHDFVYIE